MMDKTLNYYNENAQSFASGTVSVEFTEIQDKFCKSLIREHIYSILAAAQEGTRNIFRPGLSGRGNRRFRTVMPDCKQIYRNQSQTDVISGTGSE